MVLIFSNENELPKTLRAAVMHIKGMRIIRSPSGDYILYKRSNMEKSTWEILITAGAGIVTGLAGIFGFQRYNAKKTTQLGRDQIATKELQYIIDTLKSYKDEADQRLKEKAIIIGEKEKIIDELRERIASLELELKYKEK